MVRSAKRLALLFCLLLVLPAEAADFFEGKTVTIIDGSSGKSHDVVIPGKAGAAPRTAYRRDFG